MHHLFCFWQCPSISRFSGSSRVIWFILYERSVQKKRIFFWKGHFYSSSQFRHFCFPPFLLRKEGESKMCSLLLQKCACFQYVYVCWTNSQNFHSVQSSQFIDNTVTTRMVIFFPEKVIVIQGLEGRALLMFTLKCLLLLSLFPFYLPTDSSFRWWWWCNDGNKWAVRK